MCATTRYLRKGEGRAPKRRSRNLARVSPPPAHASMSTCERVNMRTSRHANVSTCERVNMRTSRHANESTCEQTPPRHRPAWWSPAAA
eukprot:508479-Pleurochrysis_carterae.AAC.1